MQYKENLYTFKFLFSWFFVNGKQIFEEPNSHAICMRPDVFPKVDCDFMKMYFFATGIKWKQTLVELARLKKQLSIEVSQTTAWEMRTVWRCSEMTLIRNITRLGPGMTRTATKSCPSSVSVRQWRESHHDNRRWVLLKVQTNEWSFGSKRNCFIELLESFAHYFF